MTKRVTLTANHFMKLDGQDQIVLIGSVIDIPNDMFIQDSTPIAEAAGPSPPPGQTTTVRNVRKK